MPPLHEESSRNLRKAVDAGVLTQLCNPALTDAVSALLSGDRK